MAKSYSQVFPKRGERYHKPTASARNGVLDFREKIAGNGLRRLCFGAAGRSGHNSPRPFHPTMKPLFLLIAVFALALNTFADSPAPEFTALGDITLTDGRVFREAVFVSENPLRITVRHSEGLAQIEKAKLPDDLLARYPIDREAAERELAEAAERKARIEREREELREKELRRAREVRALQQSSAAHNAAVAERDAIREASAEENARRAAQSGAENYFRTTWRPGNNAIAITDLVVTLDEISPRPGWPGQWSFSGVGYIEYYISQGRSFSSNRVRFTGVLDKGRCTITTR
jgi:hypothetical protein